MIIDKITYASLYTRQQNKLNNQPTKLQNQQYTNQQIQFAYRDFNVSFGERLFRSPSNFYAQDFNKKNMPDTMKIYLNENYEDRQNIPPAQMMQIVFNDLKEAKTLEEVKELYYPEESLFENLHSMQQKKYREGILAEISLLKEPDKPLFKNGKDDLGLYILKKIYLEGKTLKEINKDLKQDISVVYKGLSELQYRDLANFGIKYPNSPFWHSFYVTREDFPYVQIKRKDAEFHASKKPQSIEDINKGNNLPKKAPKYQPKEHEIERITDAIMTGMGSAEETKKELKHKFRQDDPKTQFIQKYLSEIMSISLDRVHASDEMRDFFENYEHLDKSSKTRLKKYWDATPEMKALQGLVMSDTIKLFFEYYGADGNNELFTGLIDYAHSIKPAREKQLEKHKEIQKSYDEMFAQIAEQEKQQELEKQRQKNENPVPPENKMTSHNMTNAKTYTLTANDGSKLNVTLNLDDATKTYVYSQFNKYYADGYIKKYYNFLNRHPLATDKYKISLILRSSDNIGDINHYTHYLSTDEELFKISEQINKDFSNKYHKDNVVIMDIIVKTMIDKMNNKMQASKFYNYNPFSIIGLLAKIDETEQQYNANKSIFDTLKSNMEKDYPVYMSQLTNKECMQVTQKIGKYIEDYCTIIPPDIADLSDSEKKFVTYLCAFSTAYNDLTPKEKKKFLTILNYYIQKEYKASVKNLLDSEAHKDSQIVKMDDVICDFLSKYSNTTTEIITKNQKAMKLMKIFKID